MAPTRPELCGRRAHAVGRSGLTAGGGAARLPNEARQAILRRTAAGGTLTHSLLGDRLWSLLEDPFTVFDDASPRLLLSAGLIEPARR